MSRPRSLAGIVAAAITAVLLTSACGAASDNTATTGAAAGSTAPTSAVGTATPGTSSAPGTSTPTTTVVPGTTAKPGATSSSTSSTTTTAPGTDPGTLPQTDEKPTASGPLWDAGTRGLWDAVVTDDPSKALPFFFPLSAYTQVKGISDPKHDYDTRLIPYFEEDIHALHAQLGDAASRAQFVRVEVPNTAQWIKPGVEYNKGAYWRVFDSKLVYSIDGVQKSFLVKSMISWRGQWYVVHLTSIR